MIYRLYLFVVRLSPLVEVVFRIFYWKVFRKYFAGYVRKNVSKKPMRPIPLDWELSQFMSQVFLHSGFKTGDTVVIHSSFSELKVFGLNPDQLLDSILNFIGEESTLVIPAIQIYPNELTKTELSEADLMAARYVYDPESKRIWTGALAKSLISRKGSVRSLHPLNSVVAFGPKASWICADNERCPYPNGTGSAWDRIDKLNALIFGIGIDLTHSLTMIHTAEDRKGERYWPVDDWYMDRIFLLKDGEDLKEIPVKERRHIWGRLFFAERNLANDLEQLGILKKLKYHSIDIEYLKSNELLQFLNSRNNNGYPYKILKLWKKGIFLK